MLESTKKINLKKEIPNEGIPGFDWDAYISDSPGKRRVNKKIKLHPGDTSIVYCHAPYAQELYELYSGRALDIQEPIEGSVVNGKVISISDKLALVDVNWREDATIDLSKENKEYLKYIQVGFPIEVLIEKVGKQSDKGSIIASYSKNIESKKKEEIKSSIGQPIGYLGTVKELIHGGYFVDVDGIKCFMPGSLGGMNKLIDFESLLGKQIYVMAINYSREKDYIVVSHREYLKQFIPSEISKLEFSKKYSGFVTGCSKHGIFVEFNSCLTGLISRSEISEELIDDFDNRKVKPGSTLEFFVSEIVDNDKIVLSQKEPKPQISAWDDIEQRYKIPSSVTGKVRKVVKYGVFIEIEPKVVGLLHKSQLDENAEFEIGQEIEVKIVKIDKESKKVDFTM
jgi:small subunit ribosomal protein S1